jgi:DNA-binding Xre family transcriptional regulator
MWKSTKNKNKMEEITIQVTKIYKILIKRGMTQKDLHNLIKQTNNGESVSMYILNEIINGKRTNFNINTLKPIKKALNVSYDDLIDD